MNKTNKNYPRGKTVRQARTLDELFWCEARNGSGEMTEVEPALDFASSGRSGRRNALPDILGSPAGVNPSDLPLKLAELSLTGQPDYLRHTHTHTHTHSHTHTHTHTLSHTHTHRSGVLCINLSICSADGPGGAQSPTSLEAPLPPESSEEKQGS
uniref:Uncharacterized protein n=1 Tax=Sinocyclocheilus rhinocerous TaxID=307959 RepID=A0A673GXR2_9TELE